MVGRRHMCRAVLALIALLGPSMLGSLAPAAADPQAGQELPASALPLVNKLTPATASGGGFSFAVWTDYTDSPLAQVRLARRDASGAVLDEIAVSPGPADQTSPSIAFNGTNFFVVWQESGDLFGTRITPAGAVLDGYGIPVAVSRAQSFSRPALASDGSGFLVAWLGQGAGGDDVFVKRVTGAGTVLDGPGVDVGAAGFYGNLGGGPALAFNGSSYLVVWSAAGCPFCGELLGAQVSPAAALLGTGGFPTSHNGSGAYFNGYEPSVSAQGTRFVVAWRADRCTEAGGDCRVNFYSDVLTDQLSANATVLGTADTIVATKTLMTSGVSVTSTATVSLVTWADGRSAAGDIYAARLNSAGTVLDPSGIRLSVSSARDDNPTVTRSPTGFMVDWITQVDVVSNRVDDTGAVLDAPVVVVSAGHAPAQSAPAVAWDGSDVVTVWRESRPGAPDTIRFARTFLGQQPAGEGTIIASGFDLGEPVISSSGEQQLVVWPQDGKVYGARIASGSVIDASPFTVTPSVPPSGFTFPRSLTVDWNGAAYMVAWADDDSGSLGIFGARVNQSAVVLDPTGIKIASAPGDQDFPAVASNGTDFFVVWHDARNASGSDIYGTRITGAGVVSSPAGVLISAAAGAQSNPDVAWNGTRYVVVWQDRRSGTSDDIYGARLSASAVLADPAGIALSVASGDQAKPSVSVSGTNALVTWEDRRGGAAVDLYGARLTTAGALKDPQGVPLSTAATDELDPTTVTASNGRVVLGYQRLAAGAPYRADRVFLRAIAPK